MTYEEVSKKLAEEENLSPAKRTMQVPCAYCARGGNGDKSCSCGWKRTRYNKFEGCFSGTLLPENPKKGK